ncbi:MAG: LuxR family transcriptional regulator, partial [Chloroflexi bacterium]
IAQGRPAQALELLVPLLTQARQLGRVDLALQVQILTALACQAAGRGAEAMDALAEALALAEPGDYRRIFLDEGEPMAGLLRQAAARGLAPAYVARLLAGFPAPGGPERAGVDAEAAGPHAASLVEPLSKRELEVLRLLAAGLSNPEIAGELIVAASTVHSHCKSIYGKLGVHRRWDAVQRARELGLV